MNQLPIIVLGAGGHAKVLVDALLLTGAEILGLTDTDSERLGQPVLGLPILGGDEFVHRHVPGSVLLVNAIGSSGSMALRRSVHQRFASEGYEFASVIHPSAVIARSVTLGPGVQLMAGAIVQADAVIGESTIINTGATVDHDCHVGAHVHLAPGVTLSGGVLVGDSTHVGCGATVIQGVRIGAHCTVGAGAVVLRDVADGARVAGIPAKRLPA